MKPVTVCLRAAINACVLQKLEFLSFKKEMNHFFALYFSPSHYFIINTDLSASARHCCPLLPHRQPPELLSHIPSFNPLSSSWPIYSSDVFPNFNPTYLCLCPPHPLPFSFIPSGFPGWVRGMRVLHHRLIYRHVQPRHRCWPFALQLPQLSQQRSMYARCITLWQVLFRIASKY